MAEFTATLKAGPGYADPWIVVKAESAGELATALDELEGCYLMPKVSRIADQFQGAYKHQQSPEKWSPRG